MTHKISTFYEFFKRETPVFSLALLINYIWTFSCIPLLLYFSIIWSNCAGVEGILVKSSGDLTVKRLISSSVECSLEFLLINISLLLSFISIIKCYIPREFELLQPPKIKGYFYFFFIWSFKSLISTLLLQFFLYFIVGGKEYNVIIFHFNAGKLYAFISLYLIQSSILYRMLKKGSFGFSIKKREVPL